MTALGPSLAVPQGNAYPRLTTDGEVGAATPGRAAQRGAISWQATERVQQKSYVYLGLAGETGRGRLVQSGLFRLTDGGDEWETLQHGLPEAPAVRALAVHPLKPGDRLRRHAIRTLSQRRPR